LIARTALTDPNSTFITTAAEDHPFSARFGRRTGTDVFVIRYA
jgi:hypothetical protein